MRAFLLFLLAGFAAPGFGQEMRVLSFNIRYNNPLDGANGWPLRKEAVVEVIKNRADVVGLQEVKPDQRAWLAEQLPEYTFVGVGRGPNDSDESVPVLFRKDRFELLASGTFWLAEKPDDPGSMSWGNKLPRICTWAKLQDKKANAAFWFYNVHLDHQSGLSREKGLTLVADRISAADPSAPSILVGDLNATVGAAPLAMLALRERPAFRSTYEILGVPPEGTFHGFTGKTGTRAIDFIFLDPKRWKVIGGKVLKTTYQGKDAVERYVSDHFPVEADLELIRE